ncbi:MAG: NTP transferase domain-containing protein [Candidatus Lokiarchaeota archaeon]|nr:NTP transferase domain-containing protein [Candidatus Lokiarchaeota archaeon]
MKAVILAAGEGKRLRPITSSQPKPMIPLLGKPILEHIILGLKNIGINHILIIIGYKQEIIKEWFEKTAIYFNIKIDYIIQEEYLGTAHAAGYAKDFIKDEAFLMMYGDIFVDTEIFKALFQKYKQDKIDGIITLKKVDNPQEYGIITLNSKGLVEKIIEKPNLEQKAGNLANAGIFIFNHSIFKAIEKTPKSIRNEYEFTDSMQILINELNGKILGFPINDYFWNDIGLPWQLFETSHFLLDKLKKEINGNVEENVKIQGEVYIGKGTNIKSGSYIQGPCFIGENNLIGPNAFIRPYTSIENNCHIGMSEVKNSLIFSDTSIPHFNYVGDSIICSNVNLGAGTKLSNLRFDNGTIKMKIKEKLIDSGRRKLGAVMGPNSQTGINASVMCGKKIGQNSIIGAHTIVNEDVAPNTLYYQNSKGEIVKKSIQIK